MPTQAKIDRVSELKDKLERCSIAVTATYTNIGVNEMTELRRRTRAAGVPRRSSPSRMLMAFWSAERR